MRYLYLALSWLFLSFIPAFGYAPRAGDADAIVRGWYVRFLDREPDRDADRWVHDLATGEDPAQVAAGVLGSDEYYRRAGSTPRRFVDRLFTDLLDRAPTGREMRYWEQRLFDDGREDVVYGLLRRYPRAMRALTAPADEDDHDAPRRRYRR